MQPNLSRPCVVIIAGETSGDLHGAKLVRAIKKRNNFLFFCGIGGQALRDAGVRILVDASEVAVVGLAEVLTKLPGILKGLATVKKILKILKPDLLILIDFPDFNLHIASVAKRLGIPVLYYISPQIWAWRPGRVKRIGKLVDHMAVILPFEEPFYKKHDIPVTFVGHPLLDSQFPQPNAILRDRTENSLVVGLLPGSRENEILRHIPVMLDAVRIVKNRFKNSKFLMSHAPSVRREQLEAIIKDRGQGHDLEIISDAVENVFERCHLLVAASGTVTLQAALHGIPMVIIYKVSPVSYWLGRALVRVNHIGLVNLIAGKEIVPELVQHDASGDKIANKVSELLSDSARFNHIKQELIHLRDMLGDPGASERVADIALSML